MEQNDLNLPWGLVNDDVVDSDGCYVWLRLHDAFIVLAANNHHRLVEALKELADSLPFGSQPMRVMNASKKARKLIADCS